MRGIICIRGRDDKCGELLQASDDDELLEVYQAHTTKHHADLHLKDYEISGDVLIQAFDVVGAEAREA